MNPAIDGRDIISDARGPGRDAGASRDSEMGNRVIGAEVPDHPVAASQTRRMLSPPGASGFTHSKRISASGVR